MISGNGGAGIYIGSNGNSVQGNLIGTDITGTISLGNSADGIFIGSAQNNIVGGTKFGARNLISGNTYSGVVISGSNAIENVVMGNFIGTDATGTINLGNGAEGVAIIDGSNNIIADPKFVEVDPDYYQLQADSPAKNAGDDGSDMGAYGGLSHRCFRDSIIGNRLKS